MSDVRRPRAPIRLNRDSPAPVLTPFTDHFQGFEKVEAIRSVFGDRTEKVLRGLRIGFIPNKGMYMGIRDDDGNLAVGTYHLKTSPTRTLYLDIVHELFHINQRMTNGKWFHDEFMKFIENRSLYYASPIEIPAYEHTVREAERIGMSRAEIVDYLRIGEPPAETWRNFLKEMKLSRGSPATTALTEFPVKIIRDVRSKLYPFSDYFLGFDRTQGVRNLLGDSTTEVLDSLKVEFIDFRFPMIFVNDEDGHLVVTGEYFRKGTLTSVYLDTFLCLSLIKAFPKGSAPAPFSPQFRNNSSVRKAYSAMIREGRRLGLKDPELLGHLQMPRFQMSESEYNRFLDSLGIKPVPSAA